MTAEPRKKICFILDQPSIDSDGRPIVPRRADVIGRLCQDNDVDVVVLASKQMSAQARQAIAISLSYSGTEISFLPLFSNHEMERRRAYVVYRYLTKSDHYDVIYFLGAAWLAFYALAAKRQGLQFTDSIFVLHPGETTEIRNARLQRLPSDRSELMRSFLERKAIADADHLICVSAFQHGQLIKAGWDLPAWSILPGEPAPDKDAPEAEKISELIFLYDSTDLVAVRAVHGALDRLASAIFRAGVRVTFVTPFYQEAMPHYSVTLADAARSWHFPITLVPSEHPTEVREYIIRARSAVVILAENQPLDAGYAQTAIALGRPVLLPLLGGAVEAIDPALAADITYELSGESLSAALTRAIDAGLPVPEPGASLPGTSFLSGLSNAVSEPWRPGEDAPLVTVCIVHFERISRMLQAVKSILNQTYRNIEILLVDDGSPSVRVQAALSRMEPALTRRGVRLIRRKNGYVGAARNTGAAAAKGEYICFLDDDDIALPDMIENLVTAAKNRNADFVSAMQVEMPYDRRNEMRRTGASDQHPTFLPTGGPLSLALSEYTLANVTGLFSLRAFREMGGYSEFRNLPAEDYEFYTRALQSGFEIEVCPSAVYLYEIGQTSMHNRFSPMIGPMRVVDAIDPAQSVGQWLDLFRLTAGQRAAERIRLLQDRVFRLNPHQEILSSLLNAKGLADHLEHLGAYAEANGAEQFALACSEALKAVWVGNDFCPKDPVAEEEARNFAIGRLEESILRLSDTQSEELDEIVMSIREMLEQPVSPDHERIMNAVKSAPLRSSAKPELLEVLYRLALMIDDREMAVVIARDALWADEGEYLARYRDVAEAVSGGALQSGLQHFFRHGKNESRIGFGRLSQFSDILGRMEARNVPPQMLVRVLNRCKHLND